MRNKLVVVTDLASLKAYKLTNNEPQGSPRLELMQDLEWTAPREKLVERVTDQAGRFGRRGGARGTSAGERHNIELEQRKRVVRKLAGHLNAIMGQDDVDACYFAASKEINHQILAELDPRARAKITLNVPADLTKLGKTDLLQRLSTSA